MAIIYWDPVTGSDSNPGTSPTAPKLSLSAAASSAGENGEVRALGRQVTSLGNATWTQYSTTVTFSQPHGLSVGDYIAPANATIPMHHRVSSVPNSTTVVLATQWRFASGTYSTVKLTPISVSTAQSISTNYVTITFGWDTSGQQPTDYISFYIYSGSSAFITISAAYTTFVAGNGAFRTRVTSSAHTFTWGIVAGHTKITGTYIASGTSSSYQIMNVLYICTVIVDTLIIDDGDASISLTGNGGPVIINTFYHFVSASKTIVNGGATLFIYNFYVIGNITFSNGFIHIVNITPLANITLATQYNSRVYISNVTSNSYTITFSISANILAVASPLASWRYTTNFGTITRVAGRRTGKYGYRIVPTNRIMPAQFPIWAIVPASQEVSLQFYAYYTGGQPSCSVRVISYNGLDTSQEFTFTPAEGSSWTNATLVTINLPGTTIYNGLLGLQIEIKDSTTGNSIVYIDDITINCDGWIVDSENLNALSTMLCGHITQTGGGIVFPFGY